MRRPPSEWRAADARAPEHHVSAPADRARVTFRGAISAPRRPRRLWTSRRRARTHATAPGGSARATTVEETVVRVSARKRVE